MGLLRFRRLALAASATSFGAALLLVVGAATSAPTTCAQSPELPDLAALCESDNPYLITACYADVPNDGPNPPAVVAFHDTVNDGPHVTLATERQVGAVWGLAYSGQHGAVYASAFQKRQMPFGPAGPGGVYRIDLTSGDVGVFAMVPNAGPDYHEPSAHRTADSRARPWAGKTSLGDLDVTADGSELFVTNLHDRRIYRYSLADGALLGTFAHGAAGEEWSDEARPFALKSYGDRVFHGVVRTAERSRNRDDLEGRVYSSAPDGTDMRLVAEIPLTYPRGTVAIMPIWSWYRAFDHNILLNWQPWIDNIHVRSRTTSWDPATVWPMPVLADIEFDAGGDMVVGLMDRVLNAGLTPRDFDDIMVLYDYRNFDRTEWPALGAGDTLIGRRQGGIWNFEPHHEHYADGHKSMDETNLGGLAMLPDLDRLASGAISMGSTKWSGWPWQVDRGVKWYDNASGRRVGLESICSAPVDTHV